MDLTRELHESISRICEIPLDVVSDDATLEALGVDSLASAEIMTDMEIRVGRDLPVDALRRLAGARTVGDVSTVLQQSFGELGERPLS